MKISKSFLAPLLISFCFFQSALAQEPNLCPRVLFPQFGTQSVSTISHHEEAHRKSESTELDETTKSEIAAKVRKARESDFNLTSFYTDFPDLDASYAELLELLPSKAEGPLLTIVIPAYKESNRLPLSIVKLQRFLDKYPLPVKVYLSIEKSPDYTYEISEELAGQDSRFLVSNNGVKGGKGFAVRSGMLKAHTPLVMYMDADLATPLPEIINFMTTMIKNPDVGVLIGDRWSATGGENKEGRSFIRKAFSYGFNQLVKAVSVKGIDDTQCGFKMFRSEANKNVFSRQKMNDFSFDVEVLLWAEAMGYKIEAQPVVWHDEPGSTVNPILDPLKMAVNLVKMRFSVQKQMSLEKKSTQVPNSRSSKHEH
jgi:dolichyl-phosphate beta-glucosyltransferase